MKNELDQAQKVIGRQAINRTRAETDLGEVGRLSAASAPEEVVEILDRAVATIYCAIQSALDADQASYIENVTRASLLLKQGFRTEVRGASFAQTRRLAVGHLSPYLKRRVKEYIEGNLPNRILIADLSRHLNLSSGHFSRAFRRSFGESPHAYISVRRIARAQCLMLTTEEPLCVVASRCGFANQHHFNRIFRRLVGDTPAAWRRVRLARTQ
jgi:AraC-like DNA-binding protein